MRSLATLRRPQNAAPFSYAPARTGLFAGRRMGANVTTQLGAMSSVSTLFAIVHRTSNATSQIKWKLWRMQVDKRRRTAMGDEPMRTEVTQHAILDLWRKPNPFMTRQYFVESVQQHIDLVGEGVIVVVRAAGPLGRAAGPLELWPVRPDRITPVPDPVTFLAGYVYTSPDGEQIPLELEDVIHIKMPNPLDPYRGLGPVQAAMVDLDSARYSAEWNRNFFINSAEPGGVIEIPGKLSDEDYDEMVMRWREQHQGVSAAHRVAIVEHGKWVPGFTQRDMQFAELRGVSREILREAFGIHGHMLGLSEDVNRANADAGEVSFARWLVSPRAERWKGELNEKLLPMFGDTAKGLELDHCEIVPEDREADDRERTSKSGAAATLASAGWNPDDILVTVGLPPMAFNGAPATTPPAPPT